MSARVCRSCGTVAMLDLPASRVSAIVLPSRAMKTAQPARHPSRACGCLRRALLRLQRRNASSGGDECDGGEIPRERREGDHRRSKHAF